MTFGSAQGVATTQCVPLASGTRVLIGDVLQTAGSAATVRAAALADGSGVRVLRSWLLVAPAGGIASGVVPDPPTGATATQLGWSTRVPAVGAVVPAHAERTLLLEVERTGTGPGAARALHVDVASDGTTAGVDGGTAYRFAARC